MNEWCVCAAIRRTHATTAVRVRPSSFSPTFLSLFSFASSPSFVFPLHSSPSPSFSFLLQFSSFAFLHFTFLTLTLFFFLSHACARFARTKLLWLWFFRRCTWISKQIESMTHNDKRIFLYSNILFFVEFQVQVLPIYEGAMVNICDTTLEADHSKSCRPPWNRAGSMDWRV